MDTALVLRGVDEPMGLLHDLVTVAVKQSEWLVW
jgi:hypothetical protein